MSFFEENFKSNIEFKNDMKSAINKILDYLNLLDFFKNNENLYIGGSLPFVVVSHFMKPYEGKLSIELLKKIMEDVITEVKDIDIYTTNYAELFKNFNKEYHGERG